jgi:hypothetical protein
MLMKETGGGGTAVGEMSYLNTEAGEKLWLEIRSTTNSSANEQDTAECSV